MKFLTCAFAMLTTLVSLGSTTGINCEGSSNCAGNIGTLSQLQSKVAGTNANNYYSTGQHIQCVNNICAFYQNTAGGTAGAAAGYLQNLLNHGCKKCGSDPIDGSNVNNGELTANWVASP